jgi:hypothetical protein
MSWGAIWQVVKSLPTLIRLLKETLEALVTFKKEHKEKKNEEVRHEAENAYTPEAKQEAVNHAADAWGRK